MTREQMISRLETMYGSAGSWEQPVIDLFAELGFEAPSDRGLALLLAWRAVSEAERRYFPQALEDRADEITDRWAEHRYRVGAGANRADGS